MQAKEAIFILKFLNDWQIGYTYQQSTALQTKLKDLQTGDNTCLH